MVDTTETVALHEEVRGGREAKSSVKAPEKRGLVNNSEQRETQQKNQGRSCGED